MRAPARALRHHAQINDLLIGRGSFLTFVRSFSDHGTSKLKSPHALINVPPPPEADNAERDCDLR